MQLKANQVSFQYTAKTPCILQSVTLSVNSNERVGLVAPSGYGKTTLVKLLAGHEEPTAGCITLNGKPLPPKGPSPIQLISQHPENAINPRWKMQKVLEEAGQLRDDVLHAMGIREEWLSRYPRELSGGELQRFCVARALFSDTRFLIADEISTMLDVITQAQIWNYIIDEVDRRGIGMVIVTHNEQLAKRVCTRVVDLRKINNITL